MLGLAVPVLMPDVGRPSRHADGEERQQRCDEVGARVRGLREEPEAVRREARPELQPDQSDRDQHGDERSPPLRSHRGSLFRRQA